MDYEKAFDYANRTKIVSKLIEKGCGAQFTKAVAKMYDSTSYLPVINNKIGNKITTQHMVLHKVETRLQISIRFTCPTCLTAQTNFQI